VLKEGGKTLLHVCAIGSNFHISSIAFDAVEINFNLQYIKCKLKELTYKTSNGSSTIKP
jgi:hypothetical protein